MDFILFFKLGIVVNSISIIMGIIFIATYVIINFREVLLRGNTVKSTASKGRLVLHLIPFYSLYKQLFLFYFFFKSEKIGISRLDNAVDSANEYRLFKNWN